MLRVPDSLLDEAQGLGRQIHVLTEMAVELARAREGAVIRGEGPDPRGEQARGRR